MSLVSYRKMGTWGVPVREECTFYIEMVGLSGVSGLKQVVVEFSDFGTSKKI